MWLGTFSTESAVQVGVVSEQVPQFGEASRFFLGTGLAAFGTCGQNLGHRAQGLAGYFKLDRRSSRWLRSNLILAMVTALITNAEK